MADSTPEQDPKAKGAAGPIRQALEKPEFVFFRGVVRLGFYLILGLSLFFLSSLLVLSLRQHSPQKSRMQDLVGKFYVDVHNELARAQLRVTVEGKVYPDLTPGMILHQSIAPGETVRARDKLYLIVNRGQPVFRMPQFTGNALPSARAALSRMTHANRVYALKVGAVSYVASDSPRDIILAQFPPANERLGAADRIFFLVSAGPTRGRKSAKLMTTDEMSKQTFTMLRDYFHKTNQEYRLGKVKPPVAQADLGRIAAVSRDPKGAYVLDVHYAPQKARFRSGYELAEVKAGTGGICRAELGVGTGKRLVYSSASTPPGATLKILFFRQGSAQLLVKCGDVEIFKKQYSPDDFG